MTDAVAADRARRISDLPFETTAARPSLLGATVASISAIWNRRELLGLLVRREVRARYKDSSLGVLWSLVRPLAQLLIYYFVIGQVLQVARGIPGFAIFVFVGLTAWTLFTEIVSSATVSIVNNSGLIKKVALPAEIFPLAAVGGGLFTLAIQFGILLVGSAVLGQFPLTPDLVYLLPALAVILIWATAVGILLSAVNVYLRDTQHLLEVALIILFWASPIVYSYRYVADFLHGSWIEQIYLANPVTIAILGLQKALWKAGGTTAANFPTDLSIRLAVAAVVGLAVLWIAQLVFTRLRGDFAQEL